MTCDAVLWILIAIILVIVVFCLLAFYPGAPYDD
jgi:hypothetical protein